MVTDKGVRNINVTQCINVYEARDLPLWSSTQCSDNTEDKNGEQKPKMGHWSGDWRDTYLEATMEDGLQG